MTPAPPFAHWADGPSAAKPRRRVRLRRAAYLAAVIQAAALMMAGAAHADYHVEACSDLTTGAPSYASGWTPSNSGAFTGASLCDGGGYIDLMLDPGVSHNFADNGTAVFTAPPNTTIASFSLWRWDQPGPTQPYGAPENIISYDGNAVDACSQAYGCYQEGFTNSPVSSTVGASGLTAHQITAETLCGGGPGGVCPSSSEATEMRIYGGDIDLNQSTAPAVIGTTGPLIASGTHSGVQSVSFSATDNGSGVYAGTLMIDGTAVATDNPTGGDCQATRQNPDGSLVFNYVVPCPSSASGSLTFDTAKLTDGTHDVQVVISDAAGNTTTAFDGSITTDNAPTAGGQPLIDGTAQVGQVLTGTDTTFTSTASAGTTQLSRTFVRCDPQGNNCQPIAGATATSYTLTASDVGATIRYRDIATNNDGHSTADSVPTLVVTQPSGGSGGGTGGSGGGSGGSGSGSGSGGTGGSGGGGSGSGGAGGTGGPGGSGGSGAGGVTITILPNGAVSGVELGTTAKWRVSLTVSPRQVHRHTEIKLAGTVSTSPRPPAGKLVDIQARTVTYRRRHGRSVAIYGAWTTFNLLRTHVNGSFTASYRFRLGGMHRYQFRAVAPQEGGFRNATGASGLVVVTES